MSYFWMAGINLQFNGSKYEENINVEPVPGFYLLGQGGSPPNVSSPPPPPPTFFQKKNESYFTY